MNRSSARVLWLSGLLVAATLAFGPAHADSLVIDIQNDKSFSPDGAHNVTASYTVSPYALITSVEWDVTLTAHPKSTLEDMFMSISGNLGGGIAIEPGYGDSHAGTQHYAGSADLVAQDITFLANADGSLQIEFWDYSNDRLGADGIWKSGTVTIDYQAAPVPEPSTAGMLLLGLAAAGGWQAQRRRRALPA